MVPGTDTAMMIGMCHYLYENNLYDEAFIKKYTVGFSKFKDYFLGTHDNVVKNLDAPANPVKSLLVCLIFD